MSCQSLSPHHFTCPPEYFGYLRSLESAFVGVKPVPNMEEDGGSSVSYLWLWNAIVFVCTYLLVSLSLVPNSVAGGLVLHR